MSPRLAIAPINWSNDDDHTLGADISFSQCIQEMAQAGYSGCEVGHKFPKDPEELSRALQPLGLCVTSDWIGLHFTEGRTEETIRSFRERMWFLKELGATALKVCECGFAIQSTSAPIFWQTVNFSRRQWAMLLDGLHRIGDMAREAGMFIAYHQHLGTGVQDGESLAHLMAHTDPELVTLLPDTGHLWAAGIEPLGVFQEYRERIRYVHFKDVRSSVFEKAKTDQLSFMDAVRAGLFTVPSDGDLDFEPIINQLKRDHFDGWVVVEAEQDPTVANPLQLATAAHDYLEASFALPNISATSNVAPLEDAV